MKLVSLVHVCFNIADQSEPVDSTSTNSSADKENVEHIKSVKANLFCLVDDPIASILWILHSLTLQNVFLAMACGQEVLPWKFDEMDQVAAGEDWNKFYQVFCSAFDDQFAAVDAILIGKESFALQALKNMLDQYLGIYFDGPKPLVR